METEFSMILLDKDDGETRRTEELDNGSSAIAIGFAPSDSAGSG
jgi:hypothetical protein